MRIPHIWKKYYFYEPYRIPKKNPGLIRDDNKVFMKVCYPSHYFRKYKGFGISERVLNDLKKKGVIQIRIIYYKVQNKRDRKDTFRVSLQTWLDEGILHVNEDNPDDRQLILPLSKMRNDKEYQTKLGDKHD